jgi:hypothetical protein
MTQGEQPSCSKEPSQQWLGFFLRAGMPGNLVYARAAHPNF